MDRNQQAATQEVVAEEIPAVQDTHMTTKRVQLYNSALLTMRKCAKIPMQKANTSLTTKSISLTYGLHVKHIPLPFPDIGGPHLT